MKVARIASLALVFSVAASLAAIAAAPKTNDTLTVKMHALNKSAEDGTATISQSGADVKIVIALSSTSKDLQPAHIHSGTCEKLNPAPEVPLSSVDGGKSTTVLKNTTIASLLKKPVSINVHKSTSDLATYVSCGPIK